VSATGAGSVATEFVVSSVTSSAVSIPGGSAAMMTTNPWVKYLDLAKRGYLLLDINKTRTQGDYIHFSSVSSTTYTTTVGAKWQNLDGERHLRIAPSPLGPNPGNPPLVSQFPLGASSVPQVKANTGLLVFSCYPNPSYNEVIVQYHVGEASKIGISLTDVSGKVVYNSLTTEKAVGLNVSSIDLAGLPAGMYMLTLYSDGGVYTQKIIKEN
jgi:alkaline phosphatase D